MVINYQYDQNNRLIDIASTLAQSTGDEKIIYDSNDNVIESDNYSAGTLIDKTTYTYSAGLITAHDVAVNLTINANDFMTLDNQNRVIKVTYPSIYTTFSYNTAGNIASYAHYEQPSSPSPDVSESYTYDTHKSPFSNIKGNFAVAISNLVPEINNNILSYTIIQMGTPVTTTTVNYTYTYNNDGYPINRTSVIGNITGTETFTYIQR